ncbi:Hypothetical_protein [Hexamita inflata]|uniref:Hypothetical_protein n=1 Tax=Hexamita inflata TaxID=28002 RepID=A0AA86QUT7_9EUKA|nr:Hypothetical protein HINF_LOCUS45655 [Hexamita inflata]
MVAFDALFHQLDQVPGVLLSLFDFANSQLRGILPVVDQLFPMVQLRQYLPQLSIVRQTISDIPFGASSSRLSLSLARFPILRQLSFFIHLDQLLAIRQAFLRQVISPLSFSKFPFEETLRSIGAFQCHQNLVVFQG